MLALVLHLCVNDGGLVDFSTRAYSPKPQPYGIGHSDTPDAKSILLFFVRMYHATSMCSHLDSFPVDAYHMSAPLVR